MIRRAEHSADKRFTLISRSLTQDKSLSYQARGLLVYVLSKPSKWKASYDDLKREGKIGRTALDNIIKEISAAGYIVRYKERDSKGKLDWIMEVFEEPQEINQCTSTYTGASARPATVDKRALDIDSTGARVRSSSDLTDLREKILPPKRSHKAPEPEVVIDPPFDSEPFHEVLASFEKHKREMGSKLTPTSREELYTVLAQCGGELIAIAALKMAVRCGWKGVFPERLSGNGYHEPKPVARVQTIRERMGIGQ